MSLAALFVVGLLVTIIVGMAVGLLIYAAVLDGRRQRELDASDASSAPAKAIAFDALRNRPVPDTAPFEAA